MTLRWTPVPLAGTFILAAAMLSTTWGSQVNLTQLPVQEFKVIGLAARTTNAREAGPNGAIGKLWARLKGENLLDKIPHRTDSKVVALYTDYQSDKDGEYTYVLGAKVDSISSVPAGMAAFEVPGGRYAIWSAQGSEPMLVVDLWKKVWSLETSRELQRAYRTDFEVHHFSATGSGVELYIGVKKAE